MGGGRRGPSCAPRAAPPNSLLSERACRRAGSHSRGPQPMSWLEDVLRGALARGTNVRAAQAAAPGHRAATPRIAPRQVYAAGAAAAAAAAAARPPPRCSSHLSRRPPPSWCSTPASWAASWSAPPCCWCPPACPRSSCPTSLDCCCWPPPSPSRSTGELGHAAATVASRGGWCPWCKPD